MTIYTGVLFVHAFAVLLLTAGLAIEAWMLFQLRRASSLGEVRSWTAPVPGLMAIGEIIVAMMRPGRPSRCIVSKRGMPTKESGIREQSRFF